MRLCFGSQAPAYFFRNLLERDDLFIDGWDPVTEKIRGHLSNPRLNLHQTRIETKGDLIDFGHAVTNADAVINLAAICNPAQYNTRPLAVIRANFIDVCPIVEVCAQHQR